MNYTDEQDKLRREAEADARAAQAHKEGQERQREKQQGMLQERKANLANQDIQRAEREIGRVEDRIGSMDRAERRTQRDLGMKRGKLKRSEMKKVREEAGTTRKRSREEHRLEKLKKDLDSMKGGPGSGGSTPRPPGGGLIR